PEIYTLSLHDALPISLDHASENVRVNCICPGIVDTEMVARFSTDENARRQRIAMHPLGRFGQPEDIAQAAVFLASDESAWITGTDRKSTRLNSSHVEI